MGRPLTGPNLRRCRGQPVETHSAAGRVIIDSNTGGSDQLMVVGHGIHRCRRLRIALHAL